MTDPSSGPGRPPFDVVGRRVPTGQARSDEFTYSVVVTDPPARSAPFQEPRRGQEPRQGHSQHRGQLRGEQRRDKRIRTRLHDGLIAETRGRAIVDCRIRDRSRAGARLLLDKDRPLPRQFLLTDAACRTSFWATLIWQVGRDAGVKLKPVQV